jgi:hypothetical protein
MHSRPLRVVLLCAAVAACSDSSSSPALSSADAPSAAKAVADPTATVKIPLADAVLSVRSDGKFSDGTYSLYANAVCGVTGTIFYGGSGDAVVDGSIPNAPNRTCAFYPRKATVAYPDGAVDVVSGPLFDVRALENSTTRIPIGATQKRGFHVRTSSARCDGVHWGTATVGGDSVLVTRASASTWHVTTQPAPNDRATCKNAAGNYDLGEMPVDLWFVSSRDLP